GLRLLLALRRLAGCLDGRRALRGIPGGLCRLRHNARSLPCRGAARALAGAAQAQPHAASLPVSRSSLPSEHHLLGSCVPIPLEDLEGASPPFRIPTPGKRIARAKPALEAGH